MTTRRKTEGARAFPRIEFTDAPGIDLESFSDEVLRELALESLRDVLARDRSEEEARRRDLGRAF